MAIRQQFLQPGCFGSIPVARTLVQDARDAEQASRATDADHQHSHAEGFYPTSHAKVFVQHVYQASERRVVNLYAHVCGEHRSACLGFLSQIEAERFRCPECAAREEADTTGWRRGYQQFLAAGLLAGER